VRATVVGRPLTAIAAAAVAITVVVGAALVRRERKKRA